MGFQMWRFGVNFLAVRKTTFMNSSFFISDRSIKTKVCIWQGSLETGLRGRSEGYQPGDHLSSSGCHSDNGTSGPVRSCHPHQTSGEGFHCCASWKMKKDIRLFFLFSYHHCCIICIFIITDICFESIFYLIQEKKGVLVEVDWVDWWLHLWSSQLTGHLLLP